MKKIALFVTAALICASAFSIEPTWSISWLIRQAYSPENSSEPILVNYDIVWDLCWAATSSLENEVVIGSRVFSHGASSYEDTANSSLYKDGNPIFDASLENIDGGYGSVFTEVANVVGTSSPGYIWQRITATSAETGDQYTWVGDAGDPVSAITSEQIPATVLDGAAGKIGASGSSYTWTKVSSVPEPTTMALLGLGGLAMVLRRRIRR